MSGFRVGHAGARTYAVLCGVRPCSCPAPSALAAVLVVVTGARVAPGALACAVGALAAGTTTWILSGRGNLVLTIDHLIRSHKQHPGSTCNLSMDGANPWVHVRGCPWSSVAVDVLTDVDQGGSSAAASDRRSACCQTSDSGQVFLDQSPHRDDGITDHFARWGCVASRRPGASPTTRQPGGSPRQTGAYVV